MILTKQAQLQHVFGFILIGIVIFSTMALGLYLVLLLNDQGCAAEEQKLENKIQEITHTYDTYGTKQTVNLPAPCEAEAICFINQDARVGDIPALADVSLGIKELLKLATTIQEPKPNVFLVRDESIIEVGTIDKITVENNALCIKKEQGAFEFRVEGRGRSILIKQQ